jgi:putative ABC transporter, permease protein
MIRKGYQIVEIILVIISLVFLFKLYNYKQYLTEKIIEKKFGLIKEAILIVKEPYYFHYLICGIGILIMLMGFIYYCIRYEQDSGLSLVIIVIFNIILTIIVLWVFWSPILTTLCIIGVIGLLAIKGI